jgi:ATP-dependent Lhr-like helicase
MIIQMSPEQILEAAKSLDLTESFESPFRRISIPSVERAIDPLDLIAAQILELTKQGSCLVFCNTRQMVEDLAGRCRKLAKSQGWLYDPVLVHHASLDKDVKETTESELKSGKHCVAIATSSLELGIDIGYIRWVVQIQPPARVSGLRQRVGRSGRLLDQPSRLSLHAVDTTPTRDSTLEDLLAPNLLTCLAMTRLLIASKLEPYGADRHHLSTLIHQILAVLFQKCVVPLPELFETLCVRGAFRKVDRHMFEDLVRSLHGFELTTLTSEGHLMLGTEGERLTNRWDFYPAFKTPSVYVVRHENGRLGELEAAGHPRERDVFLLNGQPWQVRKVDEVKRVLHVMPAPAGAPPTFRGDPIERPTIVAREMSAPGH